MAHATPATTPRAQRLALDSNATTPVEAAVRRLLQVIEGADITVVATRGSRFAPVFRDPAGLELCCLPRHFDRVCRFVEHAVRSEGASVVWSRRRAGAATFQLYAFCGNDRHHHLRLEVSTQRTFRGVPYLTAEDLFRNRDTGRRPQRPSAVAGTLAHFLPGFLESGSVERESTTRLVITNETHPVELRALVGRMVGTRAADRFCAALREPGLSSLVRQAAGFRRALVRRALLRRPLATMGALATHALTGGRERPGFLVAVVGPSGAGTESLAAEMHTELRAPFDGDRGGVVGLSSPVGTDPAGVLRTWWRAAVAWRGFRRTFRTSALPALRAGGAVVHEGWVDEWVLEPERFGFTAGSRWVRWLVSRAPRPDVVLVSSPTSAELMRRQPDLSRRDAVALSARYEAYAAGREDAFEVPCEGEVTESIGAAMIAALAGVSTPNSAIVPDWPAPDEQERASTEETEGLAA